MARSPNVELAQRINATLDLLRVSASNDEVIVALRRRYRISKRQAYRYILEAEKTTRKLPIPEAKRVFTVKLPLSLIARLRQLASSTGASLSTLVSQALEAFLKRREHG
jgi:predicted HicB family RNase H-like nuclease